MRFIFNPGARLMLRMANEKKLPLMTGLFLLPLAVLYYEVGGKVSTATNLWVIGGVALALYAMGSFYVQADMGWRILIASMEAISKGDLTTRIKAEMGGHFGLVMKMLEQINSSLGDIVRQVRSSSETVAHSAREIGNRYGPLAAHRTAGDDAGGNGRGDGGVLHDGDAQRRELHARVGAGRKPTRSRTMERASCTGWSRRWPGSSRAPSASPTSSA